jgi:hypothetical protein
MTALADDQSIFWGLGDVISVEELRGVIAWEEVDCAPSFTL